jgi:hypothetical protein
VSWLLVLVRLTGEPSRHRVAVWRELRKAGGVPLAPGAWLVPDSAVFASAVQRAAELARRGDGDVIVLAVAARDQASGDRLREAFAEVRRRHGPDLFARAGCGHTRDFEDLRPRRSCCAPTGFGSTPRWCPPRSPAARAAGVAGPCLVQFLVGTS